MDPELKALLDQQMKQFEAFKAANDTLQEQVKKLGAEDALTAEQLKKINAALGETADSIKLVTGRADDIEKKLGRPGALGGGSAEAEAEAKALAQFNLEMTLSHQLKGRTAPAPLDLDGYRAYKATFVTWMRKGDPALFTDAERKTMSVGQDPDGGYMVPTDVSGRMVKKIYETSEMRPIASVQSISTDKLEGINDLNEANAGWVSEQGARSATTTPQVGKWQIPVHEMYAMPEATQQLLDDAAVDVEAWLAGKVSDKMIRVENGAFVTGNGAGKPRGFASYSTAATADASRAWGVLEHVATGTSGGFGTDPNGSDKLIDLVHKLKSGYRAEARWAMSRATLGAARKLKDSDGGYVWLPSMMAAQPSSLLGYPVSEFEDMAAVGADSLSIAFGNFREGYQIVDRQGFRVLRDPFTNKPYVRFYTTRRVGGDVLNFEAIKFLKFGTS